MIPLGTNRRHRSTIPRPVDLFVPMSIGELTTGTIRVCTTGAMKRLQSTLSVIALVALTSFARAEPVTLTRSEAFELHSALSQLANGLTPENTLAAADDLNTLEPAAKSFRQGYTRLLQLQAVADAAKTPEAVATFRDADSKFTTAVEEKKTYELTIITLTKEEIKAANVSVTQVAAIKRLLKPDPKPEAKK